MSRRMFHKSVGDHPENPSCERSGCKPVTDPPLNELGHDVDCEGCNPLVNTEGTKPNFDPKVIEELSRIYEDPQDRPTPRLDALMEEVRVTSATGGSKGSKQARLGSIDPQAILEMAKVAGFGEEKYARLNYMNGYDWSLSFDACMRHLLSFWSGQDLDEESGLPHLAHAAWHCLAMLAFMREHPDYDDRWKK